MTEVIGDVVIPKELIVPDWTLTGADLAGMSGASIFLSGGKLHFATAHGMEIVTSG